MIELEEMLQCSRPLLVHHFDIVHLDRGDIDD